MVLIADTVAEFVAAEKAMQEDSKRSGQLRRWMPLKRRFLGIALGRHDSSDRVCTNVKAHSHEVTNAVLSAAPSLCHNRVNLKTGINRLRRTNMLKAPTT